MMNWEHLEALRCRVEEDHKRAEEDYRLDIAAIERLERRYTGGPSSISSDTPINSVPLRSYSSPKAWSERESGAELASSALPPSAPPKPIDDDVVSSLRTMFKAGGNSK